MGRHIMKTTIEIADDLFERAQRVARKKKTTFRSLTEQGLRLVLKELQVKPRELPPLVTHPGIYTPASTLSESLGFVDALLASPQLHLLAESPGYFEKPREVSVAARLRGPRIHDARIAALCLHHGASELWSVDRDFPAFPHLKARNPLVKK